MTRLFVFVVMVILAGAANGVMDTIAFHYDTSILAKLPDNYQRYWNPALSWRNKYKYNDDGSLMQPLTERYWGSSTIFSFATDGWHLMKFLYTNLLRLSIVVIVAGFWRPSWAHKKALSVLWYVAVYCIVVACQSAGFHFTYTIIL